jgi:hypothetical protein
MAAKSSSGCGCFGGLVMKSKCAVCIGTIFWVGTIGRADITRVATFENFTRGQQFKSSFTDPISGIVFSDSTTSTGGFTIAGGLSEFGNGNYLNSGGDSGWGFQFGFTGTLPVSANFIAIDVSTGGIGNSSSVELKAFNSSNAMIDEKLGPNDQIDAFTLEITSSQYDIAYFEIAAVDIATGYDNISFTTNVPEPSSLLLILGVGAFIMRPSKQVFKK